MISFADTADTAARDQPPVKVDRFQKSRAAALHDTELVRRFSEGDESAFTEIVARHRQHLFSVAFSLLKNRGDAEEIAQDAFIRAHRGLASFRGDSSLSTWLHHVTLNLARNRYWYFHRRCRHATISLDHALGEDNSSALLDLMPCPAAEPSREVVTREFTELIATCMARLNEQQRTILTLGRTLAYGEIARVLDTNIGTVKSRIARARQNLRVLLASACPEFASGTRPAAWLEPAREHARLMIGSG